MGSSISQASGIARLTGERTVAYIGDSTFFHSGLPALVNAVQAQDDITVVILDNYITAMTGFQPSVTTPARNGRAAVISGAQTHDDGRDRLSIENVVRGLGVKEIHSVDPWDEGDTLNALKAARSGAGVNVVICRSPCVVNEGRLGRRKKRAPFAIHDEQCNSCSLCVRLLGCPAILIVDGKYTIDRDLCDGCGLCARVCKHGAIRQAVSERV